MKYIEEDMIAAIEDVCKSCRSEEQQKNKVSKTTLGNRLNSKGEMQVAGRSTFLPNKYNLVLVILGIRRAIICCSVSRK